jgi:hypothetical protein
LFICPAEDGLLVIVLFASLMRTVFMSIDAVVYHGHSESLILLHDGRNLEMCIQREPTCVPAYLVAGLGYESIGQLAKAAEIYQKLFGGYTCAYAAARAPTQVEFLFHCGLHNISESIPTYTRCQRDSPSAAEVLLPFVRNCQPYLCGVDSADIADVQTRTGAKMQIIGT